MNKHLKLVACAMLGSTMMLGGCSQKPANLEETSTPTAAEKGGVQENKGAKTTLNVFYNSGMAVGGIVEELTSEFMKENPDIKVEFVSASKDYESMMKVKMASQDMPDIFSTHGWAKGRYGEFLADLSQEAWATKVSPSLKPLISDEQGKLYVLPLDEDKTGYIYNKTLLEKYGLEVPKNMDEFLAACETITQKSGGAVTPVHIGGGEQPIVSNYYNYIATPLLISSEKNHKEELLGGKFDWNNFNPASELLMTLKNKGYLNKDVLTAKGMDTINALAKDEAVFSVTQGPFVINEAKKINPKFKGGIMPIPAIQKGDEPTFAGGEFLTWGIWKDSKNMDAAKRYLDFFAQPENMKKLCEINGRLPGLTGVDVQLGELTEEYSKYTALRTLPYFDREYLPGGMWAPMGSYGQELLAGGLTPETYSQNLAKEYKRLME